MSKHPGFFIGTRGCSIIPFYMSFSMGGVCGCYVALFFSRCVKFLSIHP